MIYVTIGTLDYNFHRLIKALDNLEADIKREIVAQIGPNPPPKDIISFPYCKRSESLEYIKKADIVITHGGSTLLEALFEGKSVIATPRMKQYGEALNDHQVDLCVNLAKKGLLINVLDMQELPGAISRARGRVASIKTIGSLPQELMNVLHEIETGSLK